ncbi:MAG: hypothetical protein FD138_3841 [Planctomycetota bacterium]|nr:MAG: hypothetical protein FD138_3841 [Planctomycetota bacterium]
MKSFVIVLIGILFVPTLMLADDAKPAEKEAAAERKEEAKPDADPEAKAKQAAETLEALGKVFEVFGAALGGRQMIAEDFAVEAVVAGELLLDVPAEGGEAAGGDPLEQQFLQQFRQLSKTELNFVRAICQPDKEQDKKLKTASNAALKTAVKKFAEIQKKLQQGIRAGEQPEWPDPRKLMSDVLLKSIKETMTDEAAKRYAAARKRAALLNLVAKLDKDLVLTADQRGKLTEAINSNWKDSWCHQLETFMYGDAYMPLLPDAQVLPVLTEKQKQIWNGIPKQHNQIWGWAGFGFVQAVEIAEEGVLVEQAAEVKAVEEKADEPKKADEKKD